MNTSRRPCPRCNRGPRDIAMAVTVDERGTVAYCHRCGYTEANNHVRASSITSVPKAYRPWHDLAEHLWETSEPLAGSLAATYLQRRSCVLPPPDCDLRYLPARDEHTAAMLARVTDAITNEPISLHFTRLTADGHKVADRPKRLLAGHRKAGGVIRLWPDDCITRGLALAEGIESALSAAHIRTPIWSTVDAGNLANFPVLNGIESLTIFGDHDDAGLRAARACAQRWADADREAFVTVPIAAGADINDVVAI